MFVPLQERYSLTARLETHITAYSVHLIVAFIALPALIWHISSAHIHDDYGMPDDWISTFDKTHFTGGRGFLWAFLFVVVRFAIPPEEGDGVLMRQVSIDCVRALLALDHYHARRYERGFGDDEVEERGRRASEFTSACNSTSTSTSTATSTASIPLPPHPPPTHIPPILILTLHTAYNALLTTILLVHVVNFFHVIDTNWDSCEAYVSPYPEAFMDPMNTSMSVLERCQRICTDSYVSGGFDVALCVGLVGCHVWEVLFRVWEGCLFGLGIKDRMVCEEEKGEERVGSGDGVRENQDKSVALSEGGECQAKDALSTAIRCRGWSAEVRRKRLGSSVKEGSLVTRKRDRSYSVESAWWSEVLLECLVP
ncbi:hypothetical protein PSPO01_03654 [Paraphaeosphaeria sporulosa]